MNTKVNTSKKSKTFVAITATLTAGSVLVATSAFGANQATVNLGTASTYAVLAGSTVTNTGATTFSGSAGGDLGLSPGTSITGAGPGANAITKTGTTHATDAAAAQAQLDLTTAYNDAAGRSVTSTPASGALGGLTLVSGTYNSASTLDLTGTLTLDAQGDPTAVWVFQAGSTLITASGSSVSLINGAQACNVFWQVGSSATLGTSSTLVGHVMALTSITATTGATIQGSLLARNGAVTLDTNTITNDTCASTATATPTPTPSASASTKATTKTKKGGKLPDTGETPWAAFALLGGVMAIAGGTALHRRKSHG